LYDLSKMINDAVVLSVLYYLYCIFLSFFHAKICTRFSSLESVIDFKL